MMLIFSSHWSSLEQEQLEFDPVPSLTNTPPNFLIAAELSQHVTPVAVVPDVVDDLVDDAASDMGAPNDSAVPLVDERERYIDQLLAEIESLQVRLETCSHSFPSP